MNFHGEEQREYFFHSDLLSIRSVIDRIRSIIAASNNIQRNLSFVVMSFRIVSLAFINIIVEMWKNKRVIKE